MATQQTIPAPRPALDEQLQQALSTLQQGDTFGSLLEIESVLRAAPDYWPGYVFRGRVQAQMGDDLGARDSFREAARFDPGNDQLHYMVAMASYQIADFDTAWEQAISAWQAGYDPKQVRRLISALRGHTPPPPDLDARLAAPRITVDWAGRTAADQGSVAAVLSLRRAVVASRALGLVKRTELANYRIQVSAPPEEGSPRVRTARLVDAAGQPVLSAQITETGPGQGAWVGVSELIEAVQRWISQSVPR